jgi:peroxiredoxin Q/BCP
MTMTADPNLRYKNFLDIFGSDGRGSDDRGSDGRGSDDRGSDGRGSDDRGSDDRGGLGNAEAADADFDRNVARNFDPDFSRNEALMSVTVNVNDKAPEFTLQDENGKEVSLKGLRGKVVVLYFYPRADTPGCTIEACEFRDTYKQMQKTGAVLLGISPDTPQAQKKFQEKFKLPFSLLADADKKVADAFGVLQMKNMYGKKVMGIVRTTFIIGPDGKIQHIFPKVKAEGHAGEVLAYLKESAKGAA